MALRYIKRITLFKIPKESDIATTLHEYKILHKNAVKDGKPYVLSNEAGRVVNSQEQRAKGWTVCVQTTFSSLDDVRYYDEECEAHKRLKSVVLPLREDASILLFESDIAPSPTPPILQMK